MSEYVKSVPGRPPMYRHKREEAKTWQTFDSLTRCCEHSRWVPSPQLKRYLSLSKKNSKLSATPPCPVPRTSMWNT